MDIAEAIHRIKEHNEIHFRKEYPHAVHITEALNIAVKNLELQIPKKAIIHVKGTSGYNTFASCPNCHKMISDFKPKFCSECGQKIDWR